MSSIEEINEEQSQPRLSRRRILQVLSSGALATAGSIALAHADGKRPNGLTSTTHRSSGSSRIDSAFRDIKTDEDSHVSFLNTAIAANGGTARPAPTFDTSGAAWNPTSLANFYELANALENTGTGAYTYATQYLVSVPKVLVAAASIGLVEGRHAGFLNVLTGRPILSDPTISGDRTDPSGKTFPTLPTGLSDMAQEVPQTPSFVLQRAAPFLQGNFSLNGGPAVPSDDFSGQGAVPFAVLNYALLLEYLEKTWYDLNVPKFFPSSA